MERLDGKRIIITGGASGMARCLVENFPGLGAKVAFMDVNDEAGEEVSKATGCPYFHCDVSKEDEVNTAVDKAVEYLGGLDVLITPRQSDRFARRSSLTLPAGNACLKSMWTAPS